ncbi:MAG: cyclic nucleotide-binding domain-containing protein [Candidatus Cloacimonetes bacterium]|nr:cyclic nucleotide-binding domain-containing protein [Candidatus Cloacimonadota bacterium]
MDTFENIRVKQFSAGDIILNEGDKSDDFYIILSGCVDVFKTNSHGDEIHISTLKDGDVFGELGIILGLPRQATIRAQTNIDLEVISPRLFSSYFNFDKDIGEKMRAMIQTMAERIRENGNRIAELETKNEDNPMQDAPSDDKVYFVAVSKAALKTLNGMQKIEITKFPFRIGRYSRRSSDRLFHKNDLYLHDSKPYILSRSHFSISKKGSKYIFRDSSSQNGCIVNGEAVKGHTRKVRSVTKRFDKKVPLLKGENDIYLGSIKDNIHFKIII